MGGKWKYESSWRASTRGKARQGKARQGKGRQGRRAGQGIYLKKRREDTSVPTCTQDSRDHGRAGSHTLSHSRRTFMRSPQSTQRLLRNNKTPCSPDIIDEIIQYKVDCSLPRSSSSWIMAGRPPRIRHPRPLPPSVRVSGIACLPSIFILIQSRSLASVSVLVSGREGRMKSELIDTSLTHLATN